MNEMNPRQKQFSLNRGASRKQIPISNFIGTIKKVLFTPDNMHLSPAGYAVYAERLKPILKQLLP